MDMFARCTLTCVRGSQEPALAFVRKVSVMITLRAALIFSVFFHEYAHVFAGKKRNALYHVCGVRLGVSARLLEGTGHRKRVLCN